MRNFLWPLAVRLGQNFLLSINPVNSLHMVNVVVLKIATFMIKSNLKQVENNLVIEFTKFDTRILNL